MPKIETWGNLPVGVREHLSERMRDRAISIADLNQFRLWINSQPEVPDGDWFKDFCSFTIRGRGSRRGSLEVPGLNPAELLFDNPIESIRLLVQVNQFAERLHPGLVVIGIGAQLFRQRLYVTNARRVTPGSLDPAGKSARATRSQAICNTVVLVPSCKNWRSAIPPDRLLTRAARQGVPSHDRQGVVT